MCHTKYEQSPHRAPILMHFRNKYRHKIFDPLLTKVLKASLKRSAISP